MTDTYTINRPVEFPGTRDERMANYGTHNWIAYDPDEPMECGGCCSKAWHVAADYPCGYDVPREVVTVTVHDDGTREVVSIVPE